MKIAGVCKVFAHLVDLFSIYGDVDVGDDNSDDDDDVSWCLQSICY